MRKSYWFAFLFVFAIFLSTDRAGAWVATGHKVIAFIAWEDMSAKTRSAVIELLTHHPRYEKDLLAGATADENLIGDNLSSGNLSSESPSDQARSVFAEAATWPDMVRQLNNPMNHTANHPAWHYIDIPFSVGGEPIVEKQISGQGPHNIVEALTVCADGLKDAGVAEDKKAVDLCWVEHLIGDIHQPLHTVSLFSAQFPAGDQGGSAELVIKTPPYIDSTCTLHFLWDTLPGDFESEEFMRIEAAGLRNDPHYSRDAMKEQLAVSDYMAWANQSHQLAVQFAYLNGQLHTAPAHHGQSTNPIPGVPPGYVDKAEHVAMRQLCLAGYRLADTLNSIFDPR